MSVKELGYVVCGAACFAILIGAITAPDGQFLIGVGVFVIVGWFIGLWKLQRRSRQG